ncbi:MAG: hypothetical protein HQM10_02575 [Candidatus Riflebacteria bacterium]|nr:hypothetical protein [Candidatus Riflebacteria bacterium]
MDKKFRIFLLFCFLVVFLKFFFGSGSIVLSNKNTDINGQFLNWREFGFRHLSDLHIPLWNPHIFCGAPYFGGFQSSLFYPPNWIHFLLPVHSAINSVIFFHILLTGIFTYFWNRKIGASEIASSIGSFLMIFSGCYFFHLYAGHLSNLCTMAWTPLIFLILENIITEETSEKSGRFFSAYRLAGIFAVSMQLLAGHVQYFYYNAFVIGFYSLVRGIQKKCLLKTIQSVVTLYLGAAFICAFQLYAGFVAAFESGRNNAGYEFASSFYLPPENLLTLVFPWLYGHMNGSLLYWNAWFPWETNLHFGITGFLLALAGIMYGRITIGKLVPLAAVCFFLTLSLGKYTPLYDIFYTYLPGFASFRGSSKFSFFAVFFLCGFAAIGFDFLVRQSEEFRKKQAVFLFLLFFVTFIMGAAIYYNSRNSDFGFWGNIVKSLLSRNSSLYFNPVKLEIPDFVSISGFYAAYEIFLRSFIILIFAIFLYKSSSDEELFGKRLAMFVLLEVCLFASTTVAFFNVKDIFKVPEEIMNVDTSYRIALPVPARAMGWNLRDISGDDPFISKRYSEYLKYFYSVPSNLRVKLMELASCRYLVSDSMKVSELSSNHLPRAQLLSTWKVLSEKDVILKELCDSNFDGKKTVIIEEEPFNGNVRSDVASGQQIESLIEMNEVSTDELIFDISTNKKSILLLNDSYSPGWKVENIVQGSSEQYKILPANYAFRAIPIEAGRHQIRMYYSPNFLNYFKILSLLSILMYFFLLYRACPIQESNGEQ